MQVKKRDGRLKPFDTERMVEAIYWAIEEYGEVTVSPEEIGKKITENYLLNRGENAIISIEDIQDRVVEAIRKEDPELAQLYSRYRRKKARERLRKTDSYRFNKEVLNASNTDNDNANIDQCSFSGKRQRITDNTQKEYALLEVISEDIAEGHENGEIYIHDLSSYSSGEHNCLFSDNKKLLKNGFSTRNGDVRGANSFSTACQLLAVIFQVQSQVQFGGVASCGVDWELEEFAEKSYYKHLEEVYEDANLDREVSKPFSEEDLEDPLVQKALKKLRREISQGCQGLYHNLNTLESRAGSQVPFTSLNFGRNPSFFGKMISEELLRASIAGIGKNYETSIFPIGIFQYKKGVNDKPGTPLYSNKLLSIESTCKRIYPNYVNGDWTENREDPSDWSTFSATMGCRTFIGEDIHTNSTIKVGRGNISPITIILPKIGLDYGIALKERDVPDIEGFLTKLDETLLLTRKGLIERYNYICNQSPKSAPFMYNNGSILNSDKVTTRVKEAMKHGTNGIGIIGMAETLTALFGKHHGESLEAYQFALDLVKRIDNFCEESKKEFEMNFALYYTPAENLCKTARNTLYRFYGKVDGVTDRPYLTNSIHIPVWYKLDAFTKLLLESPFTKYGKAGCITYVELSTNAVNNPSGIEKIIDYAMDINIPYLALNFPIDTCNDCGFSSQISGHVCPSCGGKDIKRLKRVTGYLTTDYRNFNAGKIAEVEDRVVHEDVNHLTFPIAKFAREELERNGITVPKI